MNLPPNSTEKEINLESTLKYFNLKNSAQILATSYPNISMSNIRKLCNALFEFDSEWRKDLYFRKKTKVLHLWLKLRIFSRKTGFKKNFMWKVMRCGIGSFIR